MDHGTTWDLLLPQAKFAYNNLVNRSTGWSPFEIVTSRQPRTPANVLSLPLSTRQCKGANELYNTCNRWTRRFDQIIRSNEGYKQQANDSRRFVKFQPGDQVRINVRPERFPQGSLTKLHSKRAGPFRVLKKLGANTYFLELPSDIHFSPIFNVEDLTYYDSHDEEDCVKDVAAILPQPAKMQDLIEAILDD